MTPSVEAMIMAADSADKADNRSLIALIITVVVAPILLAVVAYSLDKRRQKDASQAKKALEQQNAVLAALQKDSQTNGGSTSRDALNRIEHNLGLLNHQQDLMAKDIKEGVSETRSLRTTVDVHSQLIQSLVDKGLNGRHN